ncbi:hypothetical protein AU476_33865 [Cupriavidus sp. UYMSc13B]|nr:hypothetical protein AU476_33865 [Cupriavidus sp. UYMSc13B]
MKDATRFFLRALQHRLSQHDVQLGHWTFLRILWERDGITKRERARPTASSYPVVPHPCACAHGSRTPVRACHRAMVGMPDARSPEPAKLTTDDIHP